MFASGQGFLGTGAPLSADLNLIVQVAMGLALAAGAALARRKLYRAHAICQTAVLLMNLVMIALVMWPSFQQQVAPALARHLTRRYYFVAAAHGALGIAAEDGFHMTALPMRAGAVGRLPPMEVKLKGVTA